MKKRDFLSDLCNHDGSMFHLSIFYTILLSALTIRPDKSDMILLNKIQAAWKCLFIFSALVMATLIFTTWKFDSAKSPNQVKATQELFVYLTQTERCLRTNVTRNLDLGNRSKCRCDVVVLSYKAECREYRPAHFTYLFDNTTTWGSGRNRLFFHALERNTNYLYYIFLDDDISLKFNEKATPAMRQLSPIQAFQNWLLDYEPAVGVMDYSNNPAKSLIQLNWKICNKNLVNHTWVASPIIYFDPVINAFHAKAVVHIFPLDTRFEQVSWWFTDKYLCSVVEIKFRGQALLFFPVTVYNPLHRPYPRSLAGTKKAWREFIKDVKRDVPERFANHSLLRKFKKDPQLYTRKSQTYCMNVTRHQEIVPFAHFVREEDKNKHLT